MKNNIPKFRNYTRMDNVRFFIGYYILYYYICMTWLKRSEKNMKYWHVERIQQNLPARQKAAGDRK